MYHKYVSEFIDRLELSIKAFSARPERNSMYFLVRQRLINIHDESGSVFLNSGDREQTRL